MHRHKSRALGAFSLVLSAFFLSTPTLTLAQAAAAAAGIQCARNVTANVVALDQPLMWNRLGSQNINGTIFALQRDVVEKVCAVDAAGVRTCTPGRVLGPGVPGSPGNVMLRPDKRPRPLVLRVAAGDCLTVSFRNLLAPAANPNAPVLVAENTVFNLLIDDQVADRFAGFHVQGLQLVDSIGSDASFVGVNAPSVVDSGGSAIYKLYAPKEGAFLATSHGATFGSDGSAGNSANGLFGQVAVMPPGARIYRSDVTEEEFRLATVGRTADGFPVLNYEKTFPATNDDGTPSIWAAEGKADLPVLNTIDPRNNEIVHSEINAVVAGPKDDFTFPKETYPLERVGKRNPTVPNRLEPFRDFASLFHDEVATSQAFPGFFLHPVLHHTIKAVGDVFMINYGSGGIGPEIIANRLGVGPMHDCLGCSYEEFFLTSYAVGDPAMLVDVPANLGLESCAPEDLLKPGLGNCASLGRKANKVLYPGDVANVHHSYTGDFTKFRNTHTGKEHHIFHLHNHQWLFNASDDNGNYLDAQAIGPGSGYTYEINFGGSGNRNKSSGDAIFHCHLYPHFAQGMWYLWRNHDVTEEGTLLAVTPVDADGVRGYHTTPWALADGTPALVDRAGPASGPRVRALPDGEVSVGAPISALVPLPGKPLAPMPGRVTVVEKRAPNGITVLGSVARVDLNDTAPSEVRPGFNPRGIKNPGFPFWIAGIEDAVGQRPTTPPLDMKNASPTLTDPKGVNGWDGGLPRHALDGVAAAGGLADCAIDPFNIPNLDAQPGIVIEGAGCPLRSVVSRLSFDKEVLRAKPLWYPEDGTEIERVAMAFHATKIHPTVKQTSITGTGATGALAAAAADFRTNGNGRPGTPGGPYSDPCIDDLGHRLDAGYVGFFFDGAGGTGTRGSSPFNADSPRVYKGANFQYDAVFNKAGFHYPQQRIIGLWDDVMPTINKVRPGEPLVMRNNTFDCTMYNHTNLVPKKFELDDYEVETPTDIIGQHIHLPKWDLTTTDGAGNGWNYEDGTLAAQAVQERIDAINAFNPSGAGNPTDSAGRAPNTPLVKQPHPFFGPASGGRADFLAARTTLQRWFFDPVVNVDGVDRGLGIIFTHDHYGPSTHQQIGLYSTVLVEPAGSQWRHNETGVKLYTRHDGGPTSWQAAIITGAEPGYGYPRSGADIDGDNRNDSFREFYIEYTDFQHAYLPGVYVGANQDGTTPGPAVTPETFRSSIKPPVKEVLANPFPLLTAFTPTCPVRQPPGAGAPGGPPLVAAPPRPCSEAITADDPGMFVANYRNEPIALRIFDPNKISPTGVQGMQADGQRGDLAFAFQSRTDRAVAAMNRQPLLDNTLTTPGAPGVVEPTRFPNPINAGGVEPGDPFTPMMRAYFGDRIRVKVQAGGDEETHTATIHGLKWLQSGSGHGFSPNSGWRNSQHAGISEQFSFAAPVAPALRNGVTADYLWSVDAQQDGYWSGVWGLIRTYNLPRADLFRMPNTTVPFLVLNKLLFVDGVCPTNARVRSYDLSAVLANDVLANTHRATIPVAGSIVSDAAVGARLSAAGGTLVYNPRHTVLDAAAIPGGLPVGLNAPGLGERGPLHDPSAMMWVRTSDLVGGKLAANAPVEPVVLRAAAGECIRVTIRNRLPAVAPDLVGWRQTSLILPRFFQNGPALAAEANGQTNFEYNLMRPSSFVGLHPQLVDHDIENHSGMVYGTNPAANAIVAPGGTKTVTWYAGDNALVPTVIPGIFLAQPTPVEFGATGLSPADPMKQGNKGLIGQLVIEPAGASWVEDGVTLDRQGVTPGATRASRASATVTGGMRSLSAIWHKGTNLYYDSGNPVGGVFGEGPVSEDTYEGGSYGINFGAEPLWFRFGVPPETPLTGPGSLATIGNAHQAFSNGLVAGQPFSLAGGEPATPVFSASRLAQTRLRTTMPSANGRGSVFTLHGHVWQRAPYTCASNNLGIPGRCNPTGFYPTLVGAGGQFEVGSRAIGENPHSQWLGGQDEILPSAHFDFVLPQAGGANGVTGDYLFHDRAGVGNLNGLFGILRVQ